MQDPFLFRCKSISNLAPGTAHVQGCIPWLKTNPLSLNPEKTWLLVEGTTGFCISSETVEKCILIEFPSVEEGCAGNCSDLER